MGRPKKSETMAVETKTTELVKAQGSINNFELSAEIVAGTLTSNAKELKAGIEKELQNYSVEKYINNPDAAKTDKAFLNKVQKTVADKRKEITTSWNKPLDEFLSEMKSLENSINTASSKLNDIVKEAENKEKSEKRAKIEAYWKTLDFTVVSLDRVFNPKWLNKTVEMKDIMLEVEAITEKISTELATIKSMNDEDSDVLQSFYVETLDLNATLQKGNQLKQNRAAIKAAEEKAKPAEPKPMVIEAVIQDKPAEEKKTIPVTNAVNNKDPIMDYRLELHGAKSKLILLRKYMDQLGITYTKF